MSILPLRVLAVPPSLLRDVPVDPCPNMGPFANGILLPTLASLSSYRRDRPIQTVICGPNACVYGSGARPGIALSQLLTPDAVMVVFR